MTTKLRSDMRIRAYAGLAAIGGLVLAGPAFGAAPEDTSKSAGYLAAVVIIPAVITWLLARRANPAWSWLRIIVTFIVLLVIAGALAALGRSGGH